MFPQFDSTAESLSKASSLVFRIGTDAHLYDDPDDVSIGPLLDSRYDSEKVEALKRLLALIAQGSDVSNFFPQVVKNVASQTSEVKKLVYLYLLHYAEKRPNEALLSINCFQKDLSDPNPLVRAWALRTMAGIRLHAIAPLVLVAANKCAKDPSVYVRKCAANALPKLNDLRQEENVATLEELVSVLLSDHSPGVIGAAASAYNSICPQNLSLIGRKFRRLCEALPDVEEWGQVILIEILLRYVVARHGLVRESIMFSLSKTKENDVTNDPLKPYDDQHILYAETCGNKSSVSMLQSYIEGSEEYLSQLDCSSKNSALLDSDAFTPKDNTDVMLLLQCTSPLLWSQNSSVILAAAGVHWIMAPRDDVKKIVKPLLFLLRSSYSSKFVVLCNIQVFAKAMPSLFAPYYEDFFVCSSDLYQIRSLKLEILANVVTDSSIAHIFHEFQDYVKDPDRRFAADTVAAIGLCAQKIPSVANTCLGGLLALIKEESTISCSGPEGEASILVQAIVSIKAVIAQNPINNEKVIIQLARCLDTIKYPSARALVIWLVGEYSSVGPTIRQITPLILKYLARFFTSEEVETKHQILNAAAKVLLSGKGDELLMFKKILKYLLELAKYDSNYDVRNRAHLMEKLLEFPATSCRQEHIPYPSSNKELSYNLANYIFSGKLHLVSPQLCSYRAYLPGSLSQVVLHAAPGYEPLPKPGSLIVSDMFPEANMGEAGAANSSIADSTDSDTLSGSSEEESDYDSNGRVDSERSEPLDNLHENGQLSQDDKNHEAGPSQLICLDAGVGHRKTRQDTDSDLSAPPTELSELMSKTAFESWLEEQPSTSGPISSVDVSGSQAIVRISLKEITVNVSPKVHNLLEPVIGDGLSVNYSFSSEMSNVSPFLVCVELVFHNLSKDSLTNITLEDVDQGSESVSHTFQPPESHLDNTGIPKMIPIEEIESLLPNQKAERTLQVQFHHHLLPLKLAIICCEKKYPVKLQPDIGYFVKPLQMDLEAFTLKENQLRGMFEYSRRCTFSSPEGNQFSARDDKILGACRSLASKVLSNANLSIVSIDTHVSSKVDYISGLCMRFCGQMLSTSKPCLVTITADGKCYELLDLNIKVNCEETVFGLNFLNKTVAIFS